MHPAFQPESKFGVLAISTVKADFPDGLQISDGITVLRKFPIELDSHWRDWLGLDFSKITDADLILVCAATTATTENLSVAGATNMELYNRLVEIFVMLRLLGTIEYDSAFVLTGYSDRERAFCQNYTKLARFHFTRGCLPWMPRPAELETAALLAEAKKSFFSTFPDPHRARIFRGWVALNSALQQHFASDRIHGFVRALEALTRPEIGKTRRQFAERCSFLAAPAKNQTTAFDVLIEAYLMRCDVEHLHDWDRSLQKYDAADRENIAYWRTRQMETLACLAYARIFGDPEIQKCFRADGDIVTLWTNPKRVRELFQDPFDITELKLVREYDITGRAKFSEWPDEWIGSLKRVYNAD
jgi:hypothetical protein